MSYQSINHWFSQSYYHEMFFLFIVSFVVFCVFHPIYRLLGEKHPVSRLINPILNISASVSVYSVFASISKPFMDFTDHHSFFIIIFLLVVIVFFLFVAPRFSSNQDENKEKNDNQEHEN